MQPCLQPEPVSEAAWAPFGWIPVADTDVRDGAHHLEFTLDDAHLNVIGHERDTLRRTPRGVWCDELFRHRTHTQALVVLDHRSVIVVAPPEASPEDLSKGGEVRAFALRPLEVIVLHRSTWHWGPYPLHAPAVRLLNVQGARYREDNARVDLRARGASLLVSTG